MRVVPTLAALVLIVFAIGSNASHHEYEGAVHKSSSSILDYVDWPRAMTEWDVWKPRRNAAYYPDLNEHGGGTVTRLQPGQKRFTPAEPVAYVIRMNDDGTYRVDEPLSTRPWKRATSNMTYSPSLNALVGATRIEVNGYYTNLIVTITVGNATLHQLAFDFFLQDPDTGVLALIGHARV